MSSIRKSAVAGQFYTANPRHLKSEIQKYLDNAQLKKEFRDTFAIVSPHAGYIYSGQTAAYGYKAIQNQPFDTVIVIAPCHSYGGFTVSVNNVDYYETPLGNIPLDREFIEHLLTNEFFDTIPSAHQREHSLEVQLPFLQTVLSDFRLVPILIGRQDLAISEQLSKELSNLLKESEKKVLFVISTDLSHYHPAETAKNMDRLIIESAIDKRDAKLLDRYVHTGSAEACGFGPLETAILLAEEFSVRNAEVLNYSHSGETSGDYSAVVGYLSAIFYGV